MAPRTAGEQVIGSVPVPKTSAFESVTTLDPVVVELSAILSRLGQLGRVEVDDPAMEADRVDRIPVLERVKAAAAAAQAGEVVLFAQAQVARQQAADLHPRVVGRGIADQVGLACRISPTAGSQRLALARAVWFDLPTTFANLRAGTVSEWVATLVHRETSHLDRASRRHVDAQLGPVLGSLSPGRVAATARKFAYAADPVAAVARARGEAKQRRVTVRPAPDTMAFLTGYLPAAQAIAAWAALGRHADRCTATGDARTRGQIMADTLVERLTGQTTATDLAVEINLVMPLATLIPATPGPAATERPGPSDSGQRGGRRQGTGRASAEAVHEPPAELLGYGPIPAPLARDLLATTTGALFLRRLFTNLAGHLVDADPRRRRFPPAVAALILARDQLCRDPYCDAPIRHLDHITRHTDHGPSTSTNGRGVCARGNYTRELPGWNVQLRDDGTASQPHTVTLTTPTGHNYTSQAPMPPRDESRGQGLRVTFREGSLRTAAGDHTNTSR